MSALPLRIAVTGASGRLGSALMHALKGRDRVTPIAWRRPEFDLDRAAPEQSMDRDRPNIVIHAAAWTDVDGCTQDPQAAMRRNGEAVGEIAVACARRGIGLVVVSTNEVFEGDRSDGLGYTESDEPHPRNVYGASKLAGERWAQDAFGQAPGLWVVRTAWLFGPPGNDFPAKIIAAADRMPAGEALGVVSDESGTPTYTGDLAVGLLDLVDRTDGGTFHLVNDGVATRYDWAKVVMARCRRERELRPVLQQEFARASQPPAWGVLDPSLASLVAGVRLRGWRDALGDYLESMN